MRTGPAWPKQEMAASALRVLAVAYRELPAGIVYDENAVENDMVFSASRA